VIDESTTPERTMFHENFQNLDRWHLEGLTAGVSLRDGALRLACEGSRQGAEGVMAFCRQDFPDHIAIEYDLLVETHNGLLITFLAMAGIHGEDAITGVAARRGVFDDYVGENASTRSYHVSICRYDDAGRHTGVSNWRRNPGLHLMTSGEDLCRDINRPYHVRITKSGPKLAVYVDGQLGANVVDPQMIPDPIPSAGKIGFRAIGSSAVFRISNLTVAAL
jgi:hypothetical protein